MQSLLLAVFLMSHMVFIKLWEVDKPHDEAVEDLVVICLPLRYRNEWNGGNEHSFKCLPFPWLGHGTLGRQMFPHCPHHHYPCFLRVMVGCGYTPASPWARTVLGSVTCCSGWDPGLGFGIRSDGIRSEFGVRVDLASVSGSLHQLYFHVWYLVVGGGHIVKSNSETGGATTGQWVWRGQNIQRCYSITKLNYSPVLWGLFIQDDRLHSKQEACMDLLRPCGHGCAHAGACNEAHHVMWHVACYLHDETPRLVGLGLGVAQHRSGMSHNRQTVNTHWGCSGAMQDSVCSMAQNLEFFFCWQQRLHRMTHVMSWLT